MSDSHGPAKPRPIVPHAGHPAQHEEGEGNWLVSYADMMTLLVGFFVILLSFSSVDQQKMEEARRSITKEFGGKYQIPFAEKAERIKAELAKMGLGDQFVVKQNDEGVEISFQGTVFFTPGSAEIKDGAQGLINELLPIIKEEADGFSITIEGHTDDTPLNGTGLLRTNWDLSSLRASRVLDAFQKYGFDKLKILAIGYGETRPIVPNRDAGGNPIAENQSQNRRVVLKLLRQHDGNVIDGTPAKPTPKSAPAPDPEPAAH